MINDISRVAKDRLLPSHDSTTRGNSKKVKEHQYKRDLWKYSSMHRVVSFTNSLPNVAVETETLNRASFYIALNPVNVLEMLFKAWVPD